MNGTLQRSEELSAGPARLRIDVYGSTPVEHVLEDMNFLNYRLADVRISPEVSLPEPDIVWDQDAAKDIAYDGRRMAFTGPWPAGPIQKVVVTMLALRMEAVGLHPFHASAVRYRDRTVLFLGGESNHGKTMGQIEACRRGALLVSTETTVIDEHGVAVVGSKEPFIKKRTEGTERADKAAPDRGRREVLRVDADLGGPYRAEPRRRRRRPRDRRQLRPVVRRDDPVRAPVPDLPFAPELLPAQRAAGARLRRCRVVDTRRRCARPARTSSGGSPSGPTSSSGRPPRRCSWTRSTRSCRPDAPLRLRAAGPPRGGARAARRARPGGAPPGRRDRPDHPPARRDDPAAPRRRRQGHRRARRRDPGAATDTSRSARRR